MFPSSVERMESSYPDGSVRKIYSQPPTTSHWNVVFSLFHNTGDGQFPEISIYHLQKPVRIDAHVISVTKEAEFFFFVLLVNTYV